MAPAARFLVRESVCGCGLSACPAAGDPRAPDLLQTAQDQFDAAGGYDADKRIANVLTGLGFKQSDWSKLCSEFSGGWQMRIALARLLLGPAGQDAASGASAGVLFLARPRPGRTRAQLSCLSIARLRARGRSHSTAPRAGRADQPPGPRGVQVAGRVPEGLGRGCAHPPRAPALPRRAPLSGSRSPGPAGPRRQAWSSSAMTRSCWSPRATASSKCAAAGCTTTSVRAAAGRSSFDN